MTAAHTALELVKSLKRPGASWLPPYDDEKVRKCTDEMKELFEANRHDVSILRPSGSDSVQQEADENLIQSVLVRHATMERIKRCLMAYHHARLAHIKELRWQYGAAIPKGLIIFFFRLLAEHPNSHVCHLLLEIRKNLSEDEITWFAAYCQSLAAFMGAGSCASDGGGAGGIDITQSLRPPKSLVLEVRCVRDYGEFETENGCILNLTKGSQHLMMRSECESLILQGFLEQVND